MSCPKCGKDNPPNKKFCSSCGSPLQAAVLRQQGPATCPQCGTALKEGRKFCVNCGALVSPPSPQPVYSETSCRQCGASLKRHARFCSSCGAATVPPTSPPPPRAETIAPIERVTEMWQPPPWPSGLAPPPPPLRGAIHAFSIPGNVATDFISRIGLFRSLSGSQLGALLMRLIKTSETIPRKQEEGPAKRNTLSQPTRRCPNCNQPVAAGKKFCTGCGQLLT
jgi:predicted nucleic acid-binding Zn ribbon protein